MSRAKRGSFQQAKEKEVCILWSHSSALCTNLLRTALLDSGVALALDFSIDGQISSFCPDQLESMLLTLLMLHKLNKSLKNNEKYLFSRGKDA